MRIKKQKSVNILLLFLIVSLGLFGCASAPQGEEPGTAELPVDAPLKEDPASSEEDISVAETKVIYLAGGCFWGIEHLMQSIPGVLDAESGYANGTGEEEANYEAVCGGETGFRETVKVEYDPAEVSLDALLLAYFYVIDPTLENQQGNDKKPAENQRDDSFSLWFCQADNVVHITHSVLLLVFDAHILSQAI